MADVKKMAEFECKILTKHIEEGWCPVITLLLGDDGQMKTLYKSSMVKKEALFLFHDREVYRFLRE